MKIYPSRFASLEDSQEQLLRLEAALEDTLALLPEENRKIVEDYRDLMRERENRIRMDAYSSGLQVGMRRAKQQ